MSISLYNVVLHITKQNFNKKLTLKMQFTYIFQFLFALQQICRRAVIISKNTAWGWLHQPIILFYYLLFSVRLGTENKSINYTPAFSQ